MHPETAESVPFFTIVAIFCPFSQFCEIYISLLSLQKQPNTAPNLFQRGLEYGKYVYVEGVTIMSTAYVSHIHMPMHAMNALNALLSGEVL